MRADSFFNFEDLTLVSNLYFKAQYILIKTNGNGKPMFFENRVTNIYLDFTIANFHFHHGDNVKTCFRR